MNDRDSLKARIDTLSPMAVRFVARLVDSLADAPTPNAITPTWLTRHPEWIEYFGLAVSAHHGTTTEPLGLTIVLLRAFREPGTVPNRYQLVEIPSDLFKSLEDVPESAFAADGPVIDCAHGGLSSAAQVSIDRSDAKITIRRVQLSACIVHAEWRLVIPTAGPSESLGSPASRAPLLQKR